MYQWMIRFFALSTLVCSFSYSQISNATPLTVTTFNIEWFGLGGSLDNDFGDEYRDSKIRDFIDQHIGNSDLILFQEIVDVQRLQSQVMGRRMNCTSYQHDIEKHQHVVLCVKPEFRFVRARDDNNFGLEDVTLGREKSRPALHGILQDRNGRDIAHILGVHLKAYADESDTRMRQTEIIADRISSQLRDLPVIVLGDFNSHTRENTGRSKDDKYLMDDVFERSGAGLKWVYNYGDTYRKGRNAQQLDQIWVSESVNIRSRARIDGPCNTSNKSKGKYRDPEYYNDQVSDHCPLTVDLEIR